jgi:hypothetical protein
MVWKELVTGAWGLMHGRIQIEHGGFDKPIAELEHVAAVFNRISKRVTAGIIAAALFITSGLLMIAGQGQTTEAFQIAGLVCLLIAGITVIAIAVEAWLH